MKKRPLICIVAANCIKQFLIDTINGAISQAQICNCDIAVLTPLTHFLDVPTELHRESESEIYKLILSDDFDGYIYCKSPSSMNTKIMKNIEALLLKTNKFIMVADGDSKERFDYTQSDDFDDFKHIIEHLIKVHGYKKIYCLTGPKTLFQSEERLKGYFAAMDGQELYYDETYYSYGDFWEIIPKEYAAKIASGELAFPEAIACGNDIMAYSLIESLEGYGIHVPSDIAVTGYDGCELDSSSGILLTTYTKNNFQLGADCMRRLYHNISGRLCSRAVNKENGLVLGNSCGCTKLPVVSGKKLREKKIIDRYRDHMNHSAMIFEIMKAKSVTELFRQCNYYSYMIYKLKYLNIFLTQECIEAVSDGTNGKFQIGIGNIMQPVYMKNGNYQMSFDGEAFDEYSILSYFGEETGKPRAFYLSPIHINKQFLGISALSFGKVLFKYDVTYMFFIRNIEVVLDRLMHEAYRGKYGMQELFGWTKLFPETSSELVFLCCEIIDINLLYGKYGGTRTISMVKNSVKQIETHFEGEAVCGIIGDNRIGIIVSNQLKTEDIFVYLKRISVSASIPFSFSLGESRFCVNSLKEADVLFDLMGEAINHTVYTYRQQSGGSRQLYERMYALRKELREAPEREWGIDSMSSELHVSRSTLQKNYKAFFGKSIIEELILFRLEKAKKLLTDTSLSLSAIAEQCGYSSDTYFIKQFRKLEGMTPNDYRSSIQ